MREAEWQVVRYFFVKIAEILFELSLASGDSSIDRAKLQQFILITVIWSPETFSNFN